MSKITEALKKAEQERMLQAQAKEKKGEISLSLDKGGKEFAFREEAIFYHQPKSNISEQYRILRTNILSLNSPHPRSFVVTSALRGEGKTVTCVNLALALSTDPQKSVLLVDADLRKPGIEKILGLNLERGLSEILNGEKTLGEVIFKFEGANFFFLPPGKLKGHPTEILDS